MNNLVVGDLVTSIAGHDFGNPYVIIQIDNEYVYLVDGKIRTLERPKKKKMKHVNKMEQFDRSLVEKIISKTVKNEEIKRAIKLLQSRNSGKEVE